MSDNLIDLPDDLTPNTGFAVDVVGAFFAESPTVAHGAVNAAEIVLQLNNVLASVGGNSDNSGEFWGLVFSMVSSNTENEADFRAAFEAKWTLGR